MARDAGHGGAAVFPPFWRGLAQLGARSIAILTGTGVLLALAARNARRPTDEKSRADAVRAG